jgi:hypothetical protein
MQMNTLSFWEKSKDLRENKRQIWVIAYIAGRQGVFVCLH